MTKRILFTAIAIVAFVFANAQSLKKTTVSKTDKSETVFLYYKIIGLKTAEDALKVDQNLLTAEYIKSAVTIFSTGICTVEAIKGNDGKIVEKIRSVYHILGYMIKAKQIPNPAVTGS
jgi:hypothetical protein